MDKKFALSTAGASNNVLKINITNVLSRTYGIEAITDDRLMISNMLMINDKLPATRTQMFYTNSDNQKGATIRLYESRVTDETMEIEDRIPITEIEMTFVRSVPENTPIEMTMALDNSGSLHIIAEELQNHSKLDTTFQLSNQMTEEEMNREYYKREYTALAKEIARKFVDKCSNCIKCDDSCNICDVLFTIEYLREKGLLKDEF